MPGAAAGAIKAGKAFVEIFADDSGLKGSLGKAVRDVKAFGFSVAKVGGAVTGLGTAIAAPFLVAAKRFADAGSSLNDMSARTGVSVEELSALGHAAQQTGTDMETVEGGIRKMQKALVQGSEENLNAESTFLALGLSVKKLEQLSPEDQFHAIAEAIGNIPNPTARAGAAMQVFGKSGTALLPMIEDLNALTKEAKDFGLVFTTDEAKKADALGDAIDLLKASLGRVVTSIGSALAPLLTDLATSAAQLVKRVIDWVQANGPLIETVFKVGVAIAAAGAAITALGVTIVGVGAAFGTLAALIGVLLNPITLVVAALAGLTTWFLTSTETGGKALEWLGQKFNELTADAQAAFGGIAKALKAGDIKLAGQILWAELKLEWIKGTNYLREVSRDGLDFIMGLYDKFRYGVASLITDAMTGVQAAFVNGWHAIAGIVDSAGAGIYKSWLVITDQILSAWEDAWAAIGMPVEGAAAAKAERAKGIAAVDQGASDTAKEREAKRQKELAGIGQQNLDAQQALKDQRAAGLAARQQANQEAAAADKAAFDEAKANLAGLLDQANKLPEGAGAASKGKPGPEPLTPESLDQGLQDSKKKITANGDFIASSLVGKGIGSDIAENQLKEQKQSNKHLEQLNKKASVGRLVFQS